MPNVSFHEQVLALARQNLVSRGLTVQAFSKQHSLHPSTVYAVLNGQKKCLRGEAHRAAVLLGIKQGEILTPANAER